MTISEVRIAHQFNKRAGTYDEHAAVQHVMARLAASEVASRAARATEVLEIGCGTGELTALLLAELPETRLTAVDFAGEMVRLARRRVGAHAPADFVVADAEELGFEGRFAAVVSSAAIQWLRRPEATMARFARALVPGGVMVHTTFGPDTFRQFFALLGEVEAPRAAVPPTHRLPLIPARRWEAILAGAQLSGIDVRSEVLEEEFASARAWLQTLRGTGSAINSGGRVDASSLRRAITAYDREYATGTGVVVTYEILTLVAQRESEEEPVDGR